MCMSSLSGTRASLRHVGHYVICGWCSDWSCESRLCACVHACFQVVGADGHLQNVYFPQPVICRYFTSKSRDQICYAVDRSTPEAKVTSLFEFTDIVQNEMEHRYKLSRSRWVSLLSNQMELMKDLSFLLAIVINVLLIFGEGVYTPTQQPYFPDFNFTR